MPWPTATLEWPTIRTSPVRYGNQWSAKNPDKTGRSLKFDYTRRLVLKPRFTPRPCLWQLKRDAQDLMRARGRRRYAYGRTEYKSISGQIYRPLVG